MFLSFIFRLFFVSYSVQTHSVFCCCCCCCCCSSSSSSSSSSSYYYYYYCFLRVFSHKRQLMIFHGSLSDIIIIILLRVFYTSFSRWILSESKSPQVPRSLLTVLADLNKAVVWMVSSTRPLIFKSSGPCINP